jgi:hypothetical protein
LDLNNEKIELCDMTDNLKPKSEQKEDAKSMDLRDSLTPLWK